MSVTDNQNIVHTSNFTSVETGNGQRPRSFPNTPTSTAPAWREVSPERLQRNISRQQTNSSLNRADTGTSYPGLPSSRQGSVNPTSNPGWQEVNPNEPYLRSTSSFNSTLTGSSVGSGEAVPPNQQRNDKRRQELYDRHQRKTQEAEEKAEQKRLREVQKHEKKQDRKTHKMEEKLQKAHMKLEEKLEKKGKKLEEKLRKKSEDLDKKLQKKTRELEEKFKRKEAKHKDKGKSPTVYDTPSNSNVVYNYPDGQGSSSPPVPRSNYGPESSQRYGGAGAGNSSGPANSEPPQWKEESSPPSYEEIGTPIMSPTNVDRKY